MPSLTPPHLLVLTADQVASRRHGDRVPAALRALEAWPTAGDVARPFQRTAGDEIQALFASTADVVAALECLARLSGWRVGVGIGQVEMPVPDDVRAATGEAFVAARQGVEAARSSAGSVCVVAPDATAAGRAQTCVDLLEQAWRRRTPAGWQVADLAAGGLTQKEIAARLGVTASAVSQRMRTAAVDEVARGKNLLCWLLDEARTA